MNKIEATEIAKTNIIKDNEYLLPDYFQKTIQRCEVFNSKKNKWEIREFYVCLKLVKQLKSDKELKIEY